MTYSGRFFDPLEPRAEDVELRAVERGLRCLRFNRQTRDLDACAHPLSVLSHSMRVARIAWWYASLVTDDERQIAVDTLAGLLHDAGEGLVGDRLGPIKTETEEDIERGVRDAIIDKLGLYSATATAVRETIESPRIMRADRIACFQEALIYQCGAEEWAMPRLGPASASRPTRLDIAETLHLFYPRESEQWETAVLYLARLDEAAYDPEKAAEMIGIGVP